MTIVPHNRPALGSEEQAAAAAVISSGWVAQGEEVKAFENELCHFLGLPEEHAVAVSSGTAGLFLALRVLKAENRKVACPIYACSALANAVSLAAAVPIFLDCAKDGPNLDPDCLQAHAEIAIVPHMFGIPVRIPPSSPTVIIEDCAQAIGATIDGIPVGLHGDIGVFSFYATKLLTSAGQGGMVVSRQTALIDAIRDYREFDCRFDRKRRFNFQMTDVQAAVGRVQLQKLPAFLHRRQEIFNAYSRTGLKLMDGPAGTAPARYRAVVMMNEPGALMDRMERKGIRTIIPIEEREFLDNAGTFPHATALAHGTLSLPLYPDLSNSEVRRIVAAINCSLH